MAGVGESRVWVGVLRRAVLRRRGKRLARRVGCAVPVAVGLAVLCRSLWLFLAILVIAALFALSRELGPMPTAPAPLLLVATDALDGLQTERLLLRRVRRRDLQGYLAIIDDELIRANGWAPGAEQRLRRSVRNRTVNALSPRVLVTDRRTGVILGDVTIGNLDDTTASCEIGWSMGPGSRGQGYGTEAIGAVIPALHTAGVRRVRFGTAVDNVAVQRIAAKLGMTPLPSAPHQLPNGTTVESLWFAHDADEDAPTSEVVQK